MSNSNSTATVAPQGSNALLGKPAKSSSPFDPAKARALRFKALSTARSWLIADAVASSPDAFPGDTHRTVDCRWSRINPNVSVHRTGHQTAIYGGLATCGSVWACPICCAVIQERRRLEISQAIDWAYTSGFKPTMVTFTFPHVKADSLAALLSLQSHAFKLLRSGKAWQEFKKQYGLTGLIRSLELTHGKNGWHPHTHELWFTRPLSESEQVAFEMGIRSRWMKVCQKVGLCQDDEKSISDFNRHAVDLKFNCSNSDYLAKLDSSQHWGADREVAKASTKNGRLSGSHPFDFLQLETERRALFLEYVKAMKGKRQLYWSSRLKDRVGVADLDDKQITDQETYKAQLLGLLTKEQWIGVRCSDARAELLTAAESFGWRGVVFLLFSLGIDLTHDQRLMLPETLL